MRQFLFLLVAFGLLSCNNSISIKDFDSKKWKSDHKACSGQRRSLAEAIVKNKKLWLSMDDDVLIDLLGKPEKSFYYERNTKAYTYFIEAGSQCSGNAGTAEGRKLIAEINAIGFVNRIRIEN